MFVKKFLSFALEQSTAGAGFDEHAEASPFFDQLFIHQFLVRLEHRERVDSIFGRDIAHRRQRITFVEHTVENHVHDTIAQLAIDWLTIIPFTTHLLLQAGYIRNKSICAAVLRAACSCSDIVNYNAIAHASFFSQKSCCWVSWRF